MSDSTENLVTTEKRRHSTKSQALLDAAFAADNEKTPLLTGVTKRRQKAHLKKFYEAQRNLVHSYHQDKLHLDPENADTREEQSQSSRRYDEILAKITFVLNVFLLVAKTVAAVLSNSLSVISTVIDSAVDITSGVVIWATIKAIDNHNPYEYPRGRTRLEPLAIVVVSIIMGVANIQMIIQAVESIITGNVAPTVDWVTLAILITGTVIKIVLFIFCYRHGTGNSKILAMDQRNDVITNLVALACAFIGSDLWLYADPIGAIAVSMFVAGSWFYTAAEQIPILSGKAAKPEFLNRIIRLAIEHDPNIRCLDTVFVYHWGNDFLVELHVVMEPDMTLKESHDISAALQVKLEKMPYIERAFVHCDYELDGVADKG